MFPLHATCMPDTENRSSLSINASQPRSHCRRATFLGNNGKIGGALRLSGITLSRQALFNRLSPRARRASKSPGAFRQTGSPKEFRMSREAAIANAEAYFDCGAFKTDLARRVAIPTESQNPERAAELRRYIETEMRPALEAMGFVCRTLTQGNARGPFLYAERFEDKALPTVLGYGNGDVIRGLESGWKGRPLAVAAHRGRRSLLRPRRGRQQGPAHDRHRRPSGGAKDPRQARLQCKMANRDGRGDRLAGPTRAVRGAPRPARRRRADRLRRPAARRRPPPPLSLGPARVSHRPPA